MAPDRGVNLAMLSMLVAGQTFWCLDVRSLSQVVCIQSKLGFQQLPVSFVSVQVVNRVRSPQGFCSRTRDAGPGTALERGAIRRDPSARSMLFGGVPVPILAQGFGPILQSKLDTFQGPDRLIARGVQTRSVLPYVIVGLNNLQF